MQPALSTLLKNYDTSSLEAFEQALREIIQDIALLGMWRGKFFEHGAFYGGTALRLLYGLDRFSEDLDFTLIKPDPGFDLKSYENILVRELTSFGFDVQVVVKTKSSESSIHSAFLKANTMVHLIKVSHPATTHGEKTIKVKLEVDTEPAAGFVIKDMPMNRPIPFTVRTLDLPSLFAGKVAAALFRNYKFNVKGRDWYDFLWYCARKVPINLQYFESMAQQCDAWPRDRTVTISDLRQLLRTRIEGLDIDKALNDVRRFVSNQRVLDGWNREVFLGCVDQVFSNC